MSKTKLYLGLSIFVSAIAVINLLEEPPFVELSGWEKFMKVGWFIIAVNFFLQYQKFRKDDNEKISR